MAFPAGMGTRVRDLNKTLAYKQELTPTDFQNINQGSSFEHLDRVIWWPLWTCLCYFSGGEECPYKQPKGLVEE